MNSKMKGTLILVLISIATFLLSCKKDSDELLTIKNNLIGSWHSFDYKHDGEDWSDFPDENSPYLILGEYGSGFDLDENQYFTHYADSFPTEGIFRGTWKVIDKSTLEFTPTNQNNSSEVFKIKIIEIEEDFLRIHDHQVEYKFKKIN